MNLDSLFTWLWRLWLLEFGVIEGIALYHEIVSHRGDNWTLTHFIAATVPIGMRVALLAWLTYHFLWEHVRT